MDQNEEILHNFESLLKKQSTKIPLGLYSSGVRQDGCSKAPKTANIPFRARDVLDKVSKEIQALQNADRVSYKRIGCKLDKYKKRGFLAVNMIPVEDEVPPKSSNFDTQCVSNTQLINIIESAEIVDKHRGVTQEFDTTFCQKSDESYEELKNNVEENVSSVQQNNDVVNSVETKVSEGEEEKCSNLNITSEMDTLTCVVNDANVCDDVNEENNILDTRDRNKYIENEKNIDEDIPSSPVLITRKLNTPPMVFSLYEFEKFENLAIPIIEEHTDLQVAKSLINSQILGKELFILSHINENVNRQSLVLNEAENITINTEDIIVESIVKDEMTNSPEACKIEANISNVEFKDELLFSSDEEEEYVHKDIQELPLTCALETSFYDKSDVLDKTMYVGFQTASNKSIQISTDSFCRAKSILCDVDKDKASLEDLVEILDSGQRKRNLHIPSTVKCEENFDNYIGNIKDNFEKDMGDTLNSIFSKSVEQDMDGNNDIIMSQVIQFKSVSTPRLKQNDVQKGVNRTKRKLEGFKTASNKIIKITDKSFSRCKKVFQDIDLEDDCESEQGKTDLNEEKKSIKLEDNASVKLSQDIFEISDESESEVNVQEDKSETGGEVETLNINDIDILQEFKENDFKEDNNNHFLEFNTASKKDIVISENAKIKSRGMFDDILNVNKNIDYNLNKMKEDPLQCNKDTICKQSEVKEKCKMQWKGSKESTPEKCDIIKQPNNEFVGFKTASNKQIKISKQALEKTKNFYKDVDDDDNLNVIEDKSVHKYSNLQTEKDIVEELALNEDFFEDEIVESEKTETPVFVGFKTASKKTITISEKALARSKKIFEEIANTDGSDRIDVTDSNKKSKDINYVNDKNTNIAQQKSKDDLTEPKVFRGFQTASNKEVKISKEALARSKKLFQDMELSQTNNNMPATEMASNKVIEKKENMENSYLVMKIPDITIKNENDFIGFQTASLKPVEVSAESIANSIKMLNEFELKDVDNTGDTNNLVANPETSKFVGFKTASNKDVQISAKALAKCKKIFNGFELNDMETIGDDENLIAKPESSKFVGFKTASNKDVQISAKALAKSKEIFNEFEVKDRQELDNRFENDVDPKSPENTFIGFQTASRKIIPISAEALSKSKQMLGEFELNEIDNKVGNAIVTTQPDNNFTGFKTASNKKVAVSEEALLKSKRILCDFEDNTTSDRIENDMKPSTSDFVGFQTASNKEIKVSHDALVRSKKIFSDIDDHEKENINKGTIEKPANPVFKGFQTASNKNVIISDKALQNSKKLFQDIDIQNDNFNNDDVEKVQFKGFQTASNKQVKISEKALAKSKKLFEDLDMSQLDKNNLNDDPQKTNQEIGKSNLLRDFDDNNKNCYQKFQGFQTASDKKVVISTQALAKTKSIFKDIHEENVPVTKPVINEEKTQINFIDVSKEIIDTQVLNDFQDSLNTEDFCKTTPKSKRSGSPILSCPRAKKRKFETPYRREKKIVAKNTFVPPRVTNTYTFDESYKKNKKYTLKDLEKLNKDAKIETDPYISSFKFDNLMKFEFFNTRNDYTDSKINIEQLKKIFIDAVDKKIVPDGWLDNHIQLIIWKLLSYEIKFPNSMKNICTVRNILEQLKYRYDKELFNVERPTLRKILEKDDVPSKTMVLCVAAIYADDVSVTSVPKQAQNIELLVTDGWYSIRASVDRMLCKLVCSEAIRVGSKLATSGAELVGGEQGRAPWEDLSSVRLKLSGNSTRRAHWLAPLGARRGVIRGALKGLRGDGGKTTLVGVVARVYPPLYAERREGSTVSLSERLEHIRQMQFESERQALMEKIYEELERELADQESQDSESYSNENTNCFESGTQIACRMKKCHDPEEYRAQLTKSQNQLLEDHTSRRREKKIEELRVKFKEKLDKSGLDTERNVVPLLKVRIADFKDNDCGVEITTGYLSIWKPSSAVIEIVNEGAWIEIINVLPTGMRNGEIQLSAGRQTVFKPYKPKNDKFKLHTDIIKRKSYTIKELSENPSMTTFFNEIDTTGMIFLIEPQSKDFDEKKSSFQNVYMGDADKNMICVNFWGGIKKFGFESIIETGQIITCLNLMKRAGNSRKSIPQYRVTEFSCFTKTPKDKHACEITKEIAEKISKNKDKFCEDCVALKNNYSVFKTRHNEHVSPYAFKNVSVRDSNLNLTGLDFESSFKDPEISPMALLRKKQVKEKIQKLKMYGEPPPLSSICIINQSKNASAGYKSPLVAKSSIASVENLQNVTSPVNLNRTYVKKVNPVKLNFSESAMEDDLKDNVDHFAEEFESSPPLSLDSDVLL